MALGRGTRDGGGHDTAGALGNRFRDDDVVFLEGGLVDGELLDSLLACARDSCDVKISDEMFNQKRQKGILVCNRVAGS